MSFLTPPRLTTFGVAAAGGAGFVLLGLPLPLLLGPMAACLIAALIGAKMQDAGQLGAFMRTFLGVAVGSSITPETLGHLPDFAWSLAFVPLFIVVIGAVGYPLFRFVFGFNHATAWYAAMPGGLQDMLVFGEEAGGDVRALSLIHATRVLVIVTAAPLIMTLYWGIDLTQPPGRPALDSDPAQIAWMIFAGFAGWKIAAKVGLFGASILGPMILTATLSLTGIITTRPPAEIIWAAQFFIGIAVGVKYSGITWKELRIDVGAGVVYALILAAISLAFFEVIYLAGLAPALDAFLAFLPGGQAEMVIIAIIAGADLAYVVSHHLLRIILVILLAPIVARIFR
ncbi:MAG: AbrB family transcriptional regulator [Pseudotabrizicola sp.]|uniref:AbrB family transcriptional regulator n=1 Tax=Pseudotabrizicola sp. TaxID=2939647 RepID=UPI002731FB44|nr:AbrB family transcriptional regulator [Pseudotabrizicola sp.]MDP2079746.1 AbrB family transcriptional regulator [Pseudotabrizicola sp.]MDZ7574747.1 AbrB family transcriptional regulator [Pseudotabrizicola sp.]